MQALARIELLHANQWIFCTKTSAARFFLVQHTKTGKMHQMTIITKNKTKIPNGRKTGQSAQKYTNKSLCKTLQNLPKFGFLV
jgi:hypothetical protein